MPTPVPAPQAEPQSPPQSFEAAITELEKLVAKMESGSLTLEQALGAHRRGLELARYCQDLLAVAEQQVKVLEQGMLKDFPSESVRPRDDSE